MSKKLIAPKGKRLITARRNTMDKVYCPYCGKCMNPKINKLGLHAYECINCFSVSPIAATNDDAMAMAQTRVKPLQKPLTLEEAKKQAAVWEENIYSSPIPAILGFSDGITVSFEKGFGATCDCCESDYGKLWRCWATKPTQEEREAAKWK